MPQWNKWTVLDMYLTTTKNMFNTQTHLKNMSYEITVNQAFLSVCWREVCSFGWHD